ncbi:hypothetical protein DFH09DRAFT_1317987 [Mycena vulgaris]|nr:hypothetical protein DFH09DRAFT_1317987 [Mycena vulgaris]
MAYLYSNPTPIPGDGPVRMARATFLTRTLQKKIFAEARYNVLKDVVAGVSSTWTLLLNQ